MRSWIEIFERQVLVFPVLVVLLASLTFLFGGGCGAWQWWAAFIIAFTWGFYKTERRDSLRAAGVFCLCLFVYWIASNLITTEGPMDTVVYHKPAIRLLSFGWNPVYEATPAALQEKFGIQSNWIRVWHVLSIPKSVWIFSAVAYLFHGNAFNLMFPVYPILLLAVGFQIWRVFDTVHVFWKVLAVLFVIGICPSFTIAVDAVAALSAIGLLLCMWDVIRNGRWNWVGLFVFSFWMCTVKHVSAFHCGIFWVLFVLCVLRNVVTLRRLSVFALVLFSAFLVTCVSPYITQTRNFGHPLYPCYSADENKNPIVNIVSEFSHRNNDAESLGHVGNFINSYMSETVAEWYYKLKTGHSVFSPKVSWWAQQTHREDSRSATVWWTKLALCGMLVFVLIFGCSADRKILLISMACLLLVPTKMLGYVRYVPWYMWGVVLLLRIVSTWSGRWRRLLSGVVLLFLGTSSSFGSLALTIPQRIDSGYAARKMITHGSMQKLYCPSFDSALDMDREHDASLANVLLLQRQVPALVRCEVVRVPRTHEESLKYEKALDDKGCFFDASFYVDEIELMQKFSRWRALGTLDRRQRYREYPKFVLYSLFITLPKSMGQVFSGWGGVQCSLTR